MAEKPKKIDINLNAKQSRVFAWFSKNYLFFETAFFKCRPGSFHGYMNSKGEITRPEIRIYPKEKISPKK